MRRHLIKGAGEMVLTEVRDRYTFEAEQVAGRVGQKIGLFHGNEYEHTVIYPKDRIEFVKVRLFPGYNIGSLIVYCDENDIVMKLVSVHVGQYPEIPIEFPEGSMKVYVSSSQGTTEIYKHVLKFGSRKTL